MTRIVMMTAAPAEQAWILLREGRSGEEGVKLTKKYLDHHHHHFHPQSMNFTKIEKFSTIVNICLFHHHHGLNRDNNFHHCHYHPDILY